MYPVTSGMRRINDQASAEVAAFVPAKVSLMECRREDHGLAAFVQHQRQYL